MGFPQLNSWLAAETQLSIIYVQKLLTSPSPKGSFDRWDTIAGRGAVTTRTPPIDGPNSGSRIRSKGKPL